jgi:hypothetical protein
MISLTHITEAELRQFYLLEGKISGRDKEYNMLNGVQQEYVASRIYDFIIWNDHCNKSKFELYIKENLPKMEIKYDTIKKEQEQEQIKKKQEQEQEQIKKKQENDMKKKIIRDLLRLREPNKNVKKIVLQKFAISEKDYDNEIRRQQQQKQQKQQQKQRKIEDVEANKICADFARKYNLNNF